MNLEEITIQNVNANSPLLGFLATATTGEIRVSISSADFSRDFLAKASSPVYNIQNSGVTLSETLALSIKARTLMVFSVTNIDVKPADGRVEISTNSNSGDALVAQLEKTFAGLQPMQTWSLHVLVSMG